jgi:hypothetical protein
VKLLRNKKEESNGIKDDESLLCPTPPDGDCSPANIRYVQPINVTVNLNNQIGGYFNDYNQPMQFYGEA